MLDPTLAWSEFSPGQSDLVTPGYITAPAVAIGTPLPEITGEVFVATNPLDSGPGSLRDAIEQANQSPGADTIIFSGMFRLPGVDSITLTSGELVITDSLTIVWPGEASGRLDDLIIDAGGASRVFAIQGDGEQAIDVHLERLIITGGAAELGGGIYNSENLTLNRVTLQANQAIAHLTENCGTEFPAALGGGLFNRGGTVVLTDSSLIGNTAEGVLTAAGGGIYNQQGALTLINTTVQENEARGVLNAQGGGIYSSGTLTLLSSTFSTNTTTDQGGALFNSGEVDSINNVVFAGNYSLSTTGQGGAIANEGLVREIVDSSFDQNVAALGGAIYNGALEQSASIEMITNTTFSNNLGGGIANVAKSPAAGAVIGAISNSQFLSNQSDLGAAIYNSSVSGIAAVGSITESVFQFNRAARLGGAIANLGVYALIKDISNNSFVSNSAAVGAGIAVSEGALGPVVNNGFVGNSALWVGGAMFVNGPVDNRLILETDNMFQGNSAPALALVRMF